jgi:hypothetical protein
MGQWKVAVLTAAQIAHLREGGEFIDAIHYDPDDTTLWPYLHGEKGHWKGFRVLDYDSVQISPGIEVIERSRERENVLRLIRHALTLIEEDGYEMKGDDDADEEEA